MNELSLLLDCQPRTIEQTATEAWQSKFLETLRETGMVRVACRAAGVVYSTAYRARVRDAVFAEQWQDAIEQACDALEVEARRRALEGVETPVGFYHGVEGARIKVCSDSLLMFLLRAHRPLFRDNYPVEFANPEGGQKPVDDVDELSAGERHARIEQYLERRRRATTAETDLSR